jgi:imidazole glycerol-phosphate synthase subunit HisH
MIAIVDYGMANLRSVEKALAYVGSDPVITSDPGVIDRASHVVLPGVGAFCACMTNLDQSGLRQAVCRSITSSKPFLGICVGMQMLFESSTEMGTSPGMGLFPGHVVKFFAEMPAGERTPAIQALKVPHIGWNSLHINSASRLLHGIADQSRVYFVHSYYPETQDASLVAATSDYGINFCCAVEKDNVAATQFHPEKSGAVGLQILRNFTEWR